MELFKAITLVCLISGTYAGMENLPYGFKLIWTFPTKDTVLFDFFIPNEILENWRWAGIGFKHIDEPDPTMGHSELITITFDGDKVEDRWAHGHLTPQPDTKDGGYNDVILEEKRNEHGYRVYSFSRPLETYDSVHDVSLVKNEKYWIMWAFGQTFKGGVIAHPMWNRGKDLCIFSEDYMDDGSDDPFFDEDDHYSPFS
ncbi:unnamed protein product [Blepharisma stoltei]|uniref:DOMON domain-containing protein n=1 Tax=Blepharisma stoltei TaxID=1481888 RepID=A0AAU9JAE5_9CILI|nr:unnamed protein product [Blepharisma stoltei]